MAGPARVALTIFAAQIRDRPWRLAVAAVAIAVGVALAAAVYLVNESALAEFGRATRQLAGEADLVVRGPRAGFDEALYPRLATRPDIAVASPVVEVEVSLAAGGTLPVRGVDLFRAGALQPAIYGDLASEFVALLEPGAIALSARAARELGVSDGARLAVRVGPELRTLHVVGVLPESAYGRRLGIMDIGTAQWTLGVLGRLHRIDLRLRPGLDPARVRSTLGLPPGVDAVTPALEEARAVNLTRAYRVNLDMLALVALLTGAFLVFATQALAVMRRRQQLALLRALGVRRSELVLAVLVEGALVGSVGGAIGVAFGWLIARLVLATQGGDLGAGFFDATAAEVSTGPWPFLAFVFVGATVAVAGAFGPARQAASVVPARALKAGDTDEARPGNRCRVPLLVVLVLAGTALAFVPPVGGLPIAGYASIALLLLAAVLAVPAFAAAVIARLPEPRRTVPSLALAQLRGTLAQSAVSLAAIVVSFSLMVAMAIMVHSFRDSFERWLGAVLPADLYLRVAPGTDTAYVAPATAAAVARLPGVARTEFRRTTQVSLAPERPPVTVIARPLADAALPVIERAPRPEPALPPAYVSEAMRDLYGILPGGVVTLPIGGVERRFYVAGLWRDYARSTGSVVIDRATYEAYAHEARYTEAGVWLAPGARIEDVAARVRAILGGGDAVQLVETGALRVRSLAAFDRAFAITYALEAIAVAIGLLGVGLAFTMQSLARRAEFGMLRHLGLTRRNVLAMLSVEGALLGALGAAYGLLVGVALSLVLVYVVNRQSFHWSVDYVVPATQLAVVAAALVAAAAVTARLAARVATADAAVRAVREDW